MYTFTSLEDKIIYTAIFGSYDSLKEPSIVTPGWRYVCYTNLNFKSNVWEIVKIPLPRDIDPRLLARYYKIFFYKEINFKYSIWIDGSFTINCDLNEWWNEKFKEKITVIKHPHRDCIYDEAKVCIAQSRGDKQQIEMQMLTYHLQKYPHHNGLIQSGILMRENCEEVNELCERWFEHVRKFTTRDQLSFNYIFKDYPVNVIQDWKYGRNKEFIFTKHNKA